MILLHAAVLATGSAQPPQDLVDRDRLMAEVARLPTRRAARGDAEHQRGLIRTEEHLLSRLREMGYEPEEFPLAWTLRAEAGRMPESMRPPAEALAAADGHAWRNLIVELRGNENPGDVLIVGAHFDAAPGAPGADDNGSGTAALLELARVLRDRPMKRTVRLIFFNLEEIGLKGSAEYALRLRPRLESGAERVVGMLSLEMLGYYSDEPNSQRSPIPAIKDVFDPPTVGDFIALATTRKHAGFSARVADEMRRAAPGLKTLAPDFLPDAPLVTPDLLRSDNAPFLFLGIDAVMVTDTSNYRNPHYHRRTDTIDTLDAARFALTVRGLAGAVHAIAGPIDEPAAIGAP